jgi:cell division protein FtsL
MIRTSQILFWFGLTIAASLALYHTSDRVQELDQQLRGITTAIEAEQQSIHVLKAEWVYLANPARIEATAKKHLALRPTSPQQITRMEDLAEIAPTRHEAMASVAVNATPMANIHTSLALPPHVIPEPKHKATIAVASVDTGHINEHMIMQRTASAQPLPDSIGSLITELGTHP